MAFLKAQIIRTHMRKHIFQNYMRKENLYFKQDLKLENQGIHVVFLQLMLKSRDREKTHFYGSIYWAATQYFKGHS